MALSPVPEATDLALPRARPAVQRPRATAELAEAREQLREALETIEAIRGGGIDSLVIGPPGQEQVYSVASADRTYRLIVNAMSEGAATVSPRGVILDANPRLGLMTGNAAEHLIGTAMLDLISAADHAAFAQLLDVGIGDSARGEVGLTGPDGTTVPVQVAVSGFDLDGMLLRCLVLTDLTAQHAAETKVAEAAAYNRSIIDASLNPLAVMGRDGVLTDLNVATERATGYRRADLIGTAFSDYFTEPDAARASYEMAFRDGRAPDIALELRHRDGHTVSLLYNSAVYRDSSGKALGVMASARDVTQIKRAESALRESEQQHRALFHNAPIGICHVALSGEIILANRRFLEITGFTSKELRSLPAGGIVHPDDRGADLAAMQRVFSGEIDTFAAQERYLQKDGGIIWVETNHTVIRDPDGSPQMLVATVRDLTAQRDAEDKVRTLNAELEIRVQQRTADLERANNELEAFTYSVSHDLRSPLRGLSGFSALLVEEYGDRLEETGREYARHIEAASERMAELIDDLLHLSQVSRIGTKLSRVDLSSEVTAIAEELQSREPDRRVRFVIEDGVWVTADRNLIRTVLQNLVENAWKFTSRRDSATIEFGTIGVEGSDVCCYVRDNGAGFDPAQAGQLFQPFQRLHAADEYPGTGVGLASVQRIVERHGGRAWAEGAIGSGATFYFTVNAKAATRPAG